MVALVADAELPPKIGVHPRPAGLVRARDAGPPARRRGGRRGPPRDEVDRGLPGQPGARARGDPRARRPDRPETGVPAAILDAGPITAERTAAISGVAIAPVRAGRSGRPARVALIGAGVQGRSHLPVLGRGAARLRDRRVRPPPGSGGGARRRWPARPPGIAAARRRRRRPATRPRTPTSSSPPPRSGRAERQVLTKDWLTPDALVVAVDYATYCRRGRPRGGPVPRRPARAVPRQPRRRQLRRLPGPDGDDRRGDPRRHGAAGAGRVVVTHLGVGPGRSRLRRRDPPPRDASWGWARPPR